MPYQENEGKPYDGIHWLVDRWDKKKLVMPAEQRKIYETIAKLYQGKTIVDVGSSFGVGANILSHNALGVWAIDLESDLVDFGTQMFASPRLKFDQYDLLNPPTRPHAAFDVVLLLEVIEHLKREDADKALTNMKRFFKPGTVGFLSTPNRNAPEINDEHPNNAAHTYEYPAGELYQLLIKHFGSVTLFDANKLNTLSIEETIDGNSTATPVVAKLENPL